MSKGIRHVLLRLLLVVTIISIGACRSPRDTEAGGRVYDLKILGMALRNEEIRWDGTFVGLMPEVIGEHAKLLLETHDVACIPFLISSLANSNQFVAAHVVLTMLTNFKTKSDEESWNDLRVTIQADGEVDFFKQDKTLLERRWRQWWSRNRSGPSTWHRDIVTGF